MKHVLLSLVTLFTLSAMQTALADRINEVKSETSHRNICNTDEVVDKSEANRAWFEVCEDTSGPHGGFSGGSGNNGISQIYVQCESWQYDTEVCSLPSGANSAVLIQQISETNCAGRWSLHNNTLTVYDGCRARFKVAFNRVLNVLTTQCESWSYSYAPCGLPIAGNTTVWLQSRESNSACKRNPDGATWGVNNILWVNNGCRGTFASAW